MELIEQFEEIEVGADFITGKQEDCFKTLKQFILRTNFGDCTDVDINTVLLPMAADYINIKHKAFRKFITKRNGDVKLRSYTAPISMEPVAKKNNLRYKVVDGRLVITALPTNFYSAWKTLTRAAKLEINWENMAKSEIDKAVAESKQSGNSSVQAAYNRFIKLAKETIAHDSTLTLVEDCMSTLENIREAELERRSHDD